MHNGPKMQRNKITNQSSFELFHHQIYLESKQLKGEVQISFC
jgi:hypothetical protein